MEINLKPEEEAEIERLEIDVGAIIMCELLNAQTNEKMQAYFKEKEKKEK